MSPLALSFVIATLLVLLTSLALLLFYLHNLHGTLKSRTTHTRPSFPPGALESLPHHLLAHPESYRIIYERDSIPLALTLSTNQNRNFHVHPCARKIFTALMRRNMIFFATYLPQAWLLRLLARTPEAKHSFSHHHISTLAFEPGDLVCGIYTVLARQDMKCEMGFSPPPRSSSLAFSTGFPTSFGGRLVTSIVQNESKGEGEGEGAGEALLVTETLQWVLRSEAAEATGGFTLPLERGAMKWLHELASWWLLVEGAKWLERERVR